MKVSAVSRCVGEVLFKQSHVFFFEVVKVLHFVSFEYVSAEESISSYKEVSLLFWYGRNDPVSLSESMSIGEVVPSPL